MRPSPTARPGRIRWVLLALVAVALPACDPDGGGLVRDIEVTAPTTQLRPGFVMRAEAVAVDEHGRPVEGRRVTWRSLTPNTLDVLPDGLMLALAPGVGIARATSGSVSVELRLDLVNPPVAQLRLNRDTLRMPLPGAPFRLVADARDELGISITEPALVWESSAARIASVDAAGLVVPAATGTSRVTVRGDGLVATTVVIVAPPVSPNGPVVNSVAPTVAVPGRPFFVSGVRFGAAPALNSVVIDGVPVTVTAATATQLSLDLPPASAFTCEVERTVALQVSTADGIGIADVRLATATARPLGIGQSAILTTAADSRCNEVQPGTYLVAFPNADRVLGAGANTMSFNLRGQATVAAPVSAGLEAAARRNDAAARTAQARQQERAGDLFEGRATRRRLAAHLALLEDQRRIAAQARAAVPALRAPSGAAVTAPVAGTIVNLRLPRLEQPNFCANFTPFAARVVHVTDHIAVLEDTSTVLDGAPTLARQMDPDLVALGNELEARGWPVVTAFGNPLVMDSRLDDNGRVMVVFTPRMNQKLGGAILATVVNCDFFPRAQFPSSNVGEYLYAQAPTSAAPGMGPGTRGAWRRDLRATVVHELKHVASFGERIVRGQPLEETWLEESTARIAEELYGRAAYGTVRGGNVEFSAQLACELRSGDPAFPACADAPRVILPHLDALWAFLDAPGALSPLGPGAPGDFTFYGSGWSLTRWLADVDAPSEAIFFGALTTSGQSGIGNLEGRTARTWDQMLPEWALALAAEDHPETVPASPRLRFTGWDLRSNFLGLCEVAGSCITPQPGPFVRAFPLRPLALEAGPFSVEFANVVPGGFAMVELTVGSGFASQVLEVRGYRGAPAPDLLRMGLLRIH